MGFLKKAGKIVSAPITSTKALVKTAEKAIEGDFKGALKEAKKTNSITESIHYATGASRDTVLGSVAAAAAATALAGGAAGGAAGGSSAASAQLGLTGATVPASAAAGGAAGTAALYSGGAAGLTAGILSGSGQTIANLLGAGASAITNYEGAKYAADKSAQSAEQINERQIAWERERATHAHQWEIEDLKNAGLNPVLSAGGQGAATGGISAVQPDTSGYQAAGGALKGFFELLNSNRLANAQADNINAQTTAQIMQNPYVAKKTKAEIANTIATTKLSNANSAKAISDMNLNAAKAIEATANARYQDRRASGKHFEIGGDFSAQGPGTKKVNAGKISGGARISIGI